jgi:hypothetical protein
VTQQEGPEKVNAILADWLAERGLNGAQGFQSR